MQDKWKGANTPKTLFEKIDKDLLFVIIKNNQDLLKDNQEFKNLMLELLDFKGKNTHPRDNQIITLKRQFLVKRKF